MNSIINIKKKRLIIGLRDKAGGVVQGLPIPQIDRRIK